MSRDRADGRPVPPAARALLLGVRGDGRTRFLADFRLQVAQNEKFLELFSRRDASRCASSQRRMTARFERVADQFFLAAAFSICAG